MAELREPVSFEYNDLRHATENFIDKNKLGQGGFAIVYKVKSYNYASQTVPKQKIYSRLLSC